MNPTRFGQGFLGPALTREIRRLQPRPDAIFVLLDRGAREVATEALDAALEASGLHADVCVFAGGEARKSMATVEKLARRWLRHGASRESLVLGIGGGITTDVAGFTAAVMMRGARWGAVPTTLLGMADAALGGKTAVNVAEGKNLIGAFHLPEFVLADVAMLGTLPAREWNCGLGEVVKAGMIASPHLLRQLEKLPPAQVRDAAAGSLAIARAAAGVKHKIVAADPREGGVRKLLNLGHTFGHALETTAGPRLLAHGEAVALGLRCALAYAVECDLCSHPYLERIDALLLRCGLPLEYPGSLPERARLATLLSRDKKKRGARVDLILPRAAGRCEVVPEQDPRALAGVILRTLA